jgi:hypothetical protein
MSQVVHKRAAVYAGQIITPSGCSARIGAEAWRTSGTSQAASRHQVGDDAVRANGAEVNPVSRQTAGNDARQ